MNPASTNYDRHRKVNRLEKEIEETHLMNSLAVKGENGRVENLTGIPTMAERAVKTK